jgi:hypothetical protein
VVNAVRPVDDTGARKEHRDSGRLPAALSLLASEILTMTNGTTATATATLPVAPVGAAPTVAPVPTGKGSNKGKGKGKLPAVSSVPDYANMGAADLLGAFWGFIRNPLADTAALLVNTVGAGSVAHVKGELSALVSVAIGMRKAYGRGIKVADIKRDLPALTIPDGFNPTFALYLSAAKLRPDDASERKTITEVKSAIRAKIRAERKGK